MVGTNPLCYKCGVTSYYLKTAPAIHILKPGLFLPGILFSFFVYVLHSHLLCEIRHRLRNLNLLRADRFAASAADAGAGQFFLRICRKGHRCDEAALREAVFIVQSKELRDGQALWAVAGAVMAGRAGKHDFLYHPTRDLKEGIHFLFC